MEIYLKINIETLTYKIYYSIVKNIFNGNCKRGKKW